MESVPPLLHRACACGKDFVTTRRHVKWHSNHCRKLAERKRYGTLVQRLRRARLGAHGKYHSREQWLRIVKLFNRQCFYCGERCEDPQKEHIIPVCRGGTDHISNIVPACRWCNQNELAQEFSTKGFPSSFTIRGVEIRNKQRFRANYPHEFRHARKAKPHGKTLVQRQSLVLSVRGDHGRLHRGPPGAARMPRAAGEPPLQASREDRTGRYLR